MTRATWKLTVVLANNQQENEHLEVCVVLLLSVSLSLFLRLPYLWSPPLDLSRGWEVP